MDWNEVEEFEIPCAKKARLEHNVVPEVTSPMNTEDDMEDLYDLPSQEAEMLERTLSKVEAENKTERTPDANFKKDQFSLPDLGSIPDQLEGRDTREPAVKSTQSMESNCASVRSLDGVQGLRDKELSILEPKDRESGLSFSYSEHEVSQISSKEISPANSIQSNQQLALQGSVVGATPEDGHHDAESSRALVPDNAHHTIDSIGTRPLSYGTSRDITVGEIEVTKINSLAPTNDTISGNEDVKTVIHEILDEATHIGSTAVASEASTTTIKEDSLPYTANSAATITCTDHGDSSLNAMQFQYPETTKHSEAEFEIDSSPLESSFSDLSSSSSSSNDSDDDYEMLDPEEQARRLMQEDGASEDETGKKGTTGSSAAPLRTLNEKPDEVVEKPNVTVTPEMKIEELGNVEAMIENLALIKAKISGEYQVLETGSVLCSEDRTVIGVIAETLGRVQQPLYTVRFTNAAAIAEAGITKGVRIFYVERHSTYVFTQPLKAFKGSDASNIHDEEVGDDELEFSDDEAEAEYKRTKKMRRQARRGGTGAMTSGISRDPRPSGLESRRYGDEVGIDYGDPGSINYDDNAQDDEPYTLLARPTNLHEMMSRQAPPLETQRTYDSGSRSGTGRRGRGNNARGRGDQFRAGRGRGRGRGDHQGGRGEREGSQDRQSDDIQLPLPPKPTNSLPPVAPLSPYANMGPPQIPMAPPAHYPQAPLYSPQQYQPPLTYVYETYQQAQYPSNYSQPPQGYSYPTPFSQNHSGHHLNNHFQHYVQQQPHQTFQPSSPSSDIPPGAFVNPAFFGNQFSQSPHQQRFSPRQPLQPSAAPHIYAVGQSQGQTWVPPESDAAFKAAQDRLEVLRQLSGGPGPPS